MSAMAGCVVNKGMAWPSWELRKLRTILFSCPRLSFSFTKLDFQNILHGLLQDSSLSNSTLNRGRANGRTTSNDTMLCRGETSLFFKHLSVTVLCLVSWIQTQHVDNSSNLV